MHQQPSFWFALTVVGLAYACGGSSSSNPGDSGNSDDTTTSSGGSATSGSGGTQSGTTNTSGSGDGGSGGTSSSASGSSSGGSGGSSSSAGTAGASAGGSGGSGGSGTGGSSGSGGAGGSGAAGGSGGSGGSGGGSGAGGTGGSGPTGAIGVLGEPCDSPGELACAGNHQKLTVVCGGDGEWEVNQTCGEGEYCDSSEGETTGLCLVPDAACAETDLETRECVQATVVSCAPDGIRQAVLEQCVGPCEDGKCLNDRDPCIPEDLPSVSCGESCGAMDGRCPGTDEFPVTITRPTGYAGTAFRTASYGGAAPIACGENMRGHLLLVGVGPYRITAPEPWQVAIGAAHEAPCSLAWSDCVVVTSDAVVYIVTEDPTAPERNVMLELVAQDATCAE